MEEAFSIRLRNVKWEVVERDDCVNEEIFRMDNPM
jgi:hypothetical protein